MLRTGHAAHNAIKTPIKAMVSPMCLLETCEAGSACSTTVFLSRKRRHALTQAEMPSHIFVGAFTILQFLILKKNHSILENVPRKPITEIVLGGVTDACISIL